TSTQTTAVNTSTATTNITASPSFTISTKTVSDLNGGLVTTGDVLRYTIVVRNSGNMNATGIVVTDTVPANTTYVAGSITGTGANAAGAPNLVWNVGPLNGGGATTTLTFEATLGDAVAGGTVISNVASIASTQTAAVNTNTATSTVQAGFSGTLTSTTPIGPGSTVTLTLTDRNLNTNPATVQTLTVTVNNPTTGETETVTLTETGVNTGVFSGTLSTSEGSVPDPAVGVLAVAKDDVLTTTYADSCNNLGGPANYTATTTVVKPVLTISKTDAPDPVNAGSNITYTLSYSNTGNADASGVVITDTVPGNTSFVSATGGGTLAAGVVTWNIGALNAGSSASVQLVVQVASPLANGTVITNATFSIDSNETAPVAGTAITTTVSSSPILTLSKSDAPDPVAAGANLSLPLTLPNSGNANASGVVVTDAVPGNTSFVSASGGGTLA